MKRQLRERRILVTGASSAIGRCLAEKMASQGARVAVASRSAEKLHLLAESLKAQGLDFLAVAGDITQDQDRRQLLDKVVKEFGGLDVLINKAGVARFGSFADSAEEVLRQAMEVNFFAPAELIRLAIPILVNGEMPAIVNVGSVCGRRGLPACAEFSASKFALAGLTEALRGELSRFDIDILLVLPGLASSHFPSAMPGDTGPMEADFAAGLSPADVAEDIIAALQKNATETVIGRKVRWVLRFQKFFPRLLDYLIARRRRNLYPNH